jgi:hypothetical protein
MQLSVLPGTPVLGAARFDLEGLGYTNDEFVLDGVARSFADRSERPYTTRLVVRRPIDATRANGKVFVEWLNVSGGQDVSVAWDYTHRHLMRAGYTWIGVSAQRAGIEGGGLVDGFHLKIADHSRYASLAHPGDAYAYDIFSQAGRTVREEPETVVGEIVPECVVAGGQSQSATYLTTYVNDVDPEAQIFNGYLIHGRPGSAAPIAGGMSVRAAESGRDEVNIDDVVRDVEMTAVPIRDDVRVPAFTLQAECDVGLLKGSLIRQADTAHHRLWEIAGTAHADTYLISAHNFDDGRLSAEALARRMAPTMSPMGMETSAPINAGPQFHYVMQAAVEHLFAWIAKGEEPPKADVLALAEQPSADPFVRDKFGHAIGGVRSPWVDVPTATFSGVGQEGAIFAFLFGTTTPIDDARLRQMYPGGRGEYLERFEQALDQTIAEGFILPDDRVEILALAAASTPPILS